MIYCLDVVGNMQINNSAMFVILIVYVDQYTTF